LQACKNLVLAGVQSVTLVDDGVVTEDDLTAHFFLAESDVGIKV
jgi:ubiquitin-like 1-activating enzyme E1 A